LGEDGSRIVSHKRLAPKHLVMSLRLSNIFLRLILEHVLDELN
jgi:hypothetical protein